MPVRVIKITLPSGKEALHLQNRLIQHRLSITNQTEKSTYKVDAGINYTINI